MAADSQFATAGIAGTSRGRSLPAAARVAELYQRSGAAQFGMAAADFEALLAEIAYKLLPDAAPSEVVELVSSLRVDELALARACAAGQEKAWEVFLTRYREKLYDAAHAIARDESVGRELADTVYADLYGTTVREGVRVGKLASYSGRGSLEGWLRTVLAQEYVNRYRSQRRLVSLEEKDEAGEQFAAPMVEPVAAPDGRLAEATSEALRGLSAEDRLVLSAYFLDGRTLAEIGRLLRVHESTVSRRVDKITANLHKAVCAGLRSRGMSRRQAEEALEADVRDVQVNVREFLTQETQGGTFSRQGGVSQPEGSKER